MDECEEMLLEVQRIFKDDFWAEPIRKEFDSHVETWKMKKMNTCRAIYELNDEQVDHLAQYHTYLIPTVDLQNLVLE